MATIGFRDLRPNAILNTTGLSQKCHLPADADPVGQEIKSPLQGFSVNLDGPTDGTDLAALYVLNHLSQTVGAGSDFQSKAGI